jgi:hypothetical protein
MPVCTRCNLSTPEAQSLTLEGVEGALSFEQAKLLLRLSYAQTLASCQGTEFGGSLRLWDCAHPLFTRRHLFVGLSRARQDAQVSLRDWCIMARESMVQFCFGFARDR